MDINIPASEIGKFTSTERARAYMHASRIKSEIQEVGQQIARHDNKPGDYNDAVGVVVCTDLTVRVSNYNWPSEAMVTFDADAATKAATQQPTPRKGLFGLFARKPVDVPKPTIASVSVETKQRDNTYGAVPNQPYIRMSMQQCEGGIRYEYKNYNQTMKFVEDKCGNLVVEDMNVQ